jgi:LPXTG-site transpeptidase (sortase) family protein
MQSKISIQWPLLIVGVVGVVVFSIIFFSLTAGFSAQSFYAKPLALIDNQIPQDLAGGVLVGSIQGAVSPEPASAGLPVRLKIPKIKVNAVVEHVGLTSDGAMGVPKSPKTTAWFDLGARPGDTGSAVIAGHYGFKKGSVFDRLYKLRKGDKIYVEDERGATTDFVVRESRSYGQNETATSVFYSGDEKAHLNLITCMGVWNKTTKTYSKRLVVFADKEIE